MNCENYIKEVTSLSNLDFQEQLSSIREKYSEKIKIMDQDILKRVAMFAEMYFEESLERLINKFKKDYYDLLVDVEIEMKDLADFSLEKDLLIKKDLENKISDKKKNWLVYFERSITEHTPNIKYFNKKKRIRKPH